MGRLLYNQRFQYSPKIFHLDNFYILYHGGGSSNRLQENGRILKSSSHQEKKWKSTKRRRKHYLLLLLRMRHQPNAVEATINNNSRIVKRNPTRNDQKVVQEIGRKILVGRDIEIGIVDLLIPWNNGIDFEMDHHHHTLYLKYEEEEED